MLFSNDKEFVPEWASHVGIQVIQEEAPTSVRYFNLQGREIKSPEKGICLKLYPDGKVEKMLNAPEK